MRVSCVLVLACAGLACGDETGTGVTGSTDSIAPTVVALVPADGAVDVLRDTEIRVTFSEPINFATIAPLSFSVARNNDPVGGTFSQDGESVVFQPDSLLDTAAVYVGTVTRAVRDPAGNGLAENQVWSFTTVTVDSIPRLRAPPGVPRANR